jgi:hypothetical protein
MQRGNERSDCSLTPLAGNGLRSAARSKAPSSCLGGVRGVFWSPTRRKVSMKHSLAGAEAPFVHLSYNHPKRAPATILSACHSYIFRTLALLGKKEGLPEPPRTLAVTESGRQDSNLRPSAPKAPALPSCATPRSFVIVVECRPALDSCCANGFGACSG